MAIVFTCTCSKPLRAKEESAGKRTKCPHCGAIVAIPGGAAKPVGPSGAGEDALSIDMAWPTIEASPASAGPVVEPGSSTSIKVDGASAALMAGGSDRPSDRPRPTDGTLQYKVLSGKDQGMTGKFNPTKLEEVLNDHARQGWVVRSASTISVVSHSGAHDELIVILER